MYPPLDECRHSALRPLRGFVAWVSWISCMVATGLDCPASPDLDSTGLDLICAVMLFDGRIRLLMLECLLCYAMHYKDNGNTPCSLYLLVGMEPLRINNSPLG